MEIILKIIFNSPFKGKPEETVFMRMNSAMR
jgi:hypothetical protein